MHSSNETEIGWEGCNSIPGYKAKVLRSVSIEAKWETLDGGEVETSLSGLPARVFLHEYDHLDGVMILERIDDIRKDLMTREEWLRIQDKTK